MHCPECGNSEIDGSTVCSQCGYPFDNNLIICPECAREVMISAKVCSNCGFPIAEQRAGKEKGVTIDKQVAILKNKQIVSCIFLLVALMALAMSIYSVTNKQFRYQKENVSYFKSQSAETRHMANEYSGGLFKVGYTDIANKWDGLVEIAERTIMFGYAKAVLFLLISLASAYRGIRIYNSNK